MENIFNYSLAVFMAFFAIMNPMVNIPIFVKLTEGVDEKKKREIAKTANIVAFIIVRLKFIVHREISLPHKPGVNSDIYRKPGYTNTWRLSPLVCENPLYGRPRENTFLNTAYKVILW